MSEHPGDKDEPFDVDDISAAERLAGITFTESERWLLLGRALEQRRAFDVAREAGLSNDVEPPLFFDPRRPAAARKAAPVATLPDVYGDEPAATEEDLSFLPVARLARLLRSGQVTSRQLTSLSLERLKRYGPRLRCLVTLTEELALEQAARADEELAQGVDRGPLHGIPYGAKDLLEVSGYPTTWGAEPFRDRISAVDASVVDRLREAGAVLVAKLSLGELAMGDVWFGGVTLNPWDTTTGSSGSSAGSAAAVAAGLVPFAIGSETMGSIVSPATRCAVVGLRPSPGLVSRHGAMALAWTLDKLGPIARYVADTALVLQAMSGPDGRDPSLFAEPFEWVPDEDVRTLRLGYVEEAFEGEGELAERSRALLEAIRAEGVQLIPVRLPTFGHEPIMTALMVEAAAAFDGMTRGDLDDRLAQQGESAWPNLLRAARLVPAVEYLQANRLRTLAIREMHELFDRVDAYLCPFHYHRNIHLTNATGNPCVVLPLGWDERGRPLPSSMTVTGPVLGEQKAVTAGLLIERLVGKRPRPDLTGLAG